MKIDPSKLQEEVSKEISAATKLIKTRRISDGNGLMLVIRPNGQSSWVLRYTFDSRKSDFTIGAWPALCLNEARLKAQEIRDTVASGVNPAAQRRARRWAHAANSSACTVQEVFQEWLATDKKISKSSYRNNIEAALITHVLPKIAHKKLRDVSIGDISNIIQSIEELGAFEMSKRVRMWLFQIIDFAITNRKYTIESNDG